MIISVTCRHGTDVIVNRQYTQSALFTLSKYASTIIRAQAVFSRETHHQKSKELITCHLSIHLPTQHGIEIYEHSSSPKIAFEKAKERMIVQLSRHVRRSLSFKTERYEYALGA